MLTSRQRKRFDTLLESVLAELPDEIHELLETVPLVVDDYPPRWMLDEVGVDDPHDLCGLYSGIPLSQRSVMSDATMPETISIFRAGILSLAQATARGDDELRRQIRITVLHEIGHHFGMSEEDLAELGYD